MELFKMIESEGKLEKCGLFETASMSCQEQRALLEVRVEELDARIVALQARLEPFADLKLRPVGPEQRRAEVERDEVFAELVRLTNDRCALQHQLAWLRAGRSGTPSVSRTEIINSNTTRRELLQDIRWVRDRLVDVEMEAASLDAQLELWTHRGALPPEEQYSESCSWDVVLNERYLLEHEQIELLLQLGWMVSGHTGLASTVRARFSGEEPIVSYREIGRPEAADDNPFG
jgi:hypothetical protein